MSKTTRLLSLILVIAMAFSLFAVSGSAKWADVAKDAYTDYATGNYKEAIDVLTYINVIDGIADGDTKAFKPEGNLQRDAAAKIISRLVTGVTADDITPTGTAFSDVDKSHWASGYIQWAYNNNIINGLGDGTFKPASNVTVLQFLKMILTGLGWGAQGEFTGKGWDTAVYVKATELELWGDVAPVVADRAITREEAVEFALQALDLSKVYLNNAYDYMYLDGTRANGVNYVAPLYELHNLEKNGDTDAIGYLTYQWLDAKTGFKIFEGLQKYNKQLPLLPTTKVTDLLTGITASSYADVYVNGLLVGTMANTIKQTDFVTQYGLRYAGAKITSYRGSSRTLARIVIEVEYAAKVTSVSANGKTYSIEVYAGLATAVKAAAEVKGYTGLDNKETEYVVGDILAVVPVLDEVTYAAVTKTEEGVTTVDYYVLATEADDFAAGIENIAKTAKATLGGAYGGKYVYNVPEVSGRTLSTYLLGGKQTFEGATLSAAKATGEATDDFTKAKNDTQYGLNGVIYLTSSGAILRYIGAVTVAPTKYAFIGGIDQNKYDRETNTGTFSVTVYGDFDIYDKDGAIIETLTSLYEGSTFGVPVDVKNNTLIGWYEASTYAPARWQTITADTAPSTFKFTSDGYLETGRGVNAKEYALASGVFVVDITDLKNIVYNANTRGLDDTKGTIKQLYLNAAKTKVVGVIIEKFASVTTLNAAIKEVEALVESDYTAVSWAALQTALAAAEQAAAEYKTLSQDAVDAAQKDLADAKKALKKDTSAAPTVTVESIIADLTASASGVGANTQAFDLDPEDVDEIIAALEAIGYTEDASGLGETTTQAVDTYSTFDLASFGWGDTVTLYVYVA